MGPTQARSGIQTVYPTEWNSPKTRGMHVVDLPEGLGDFMNNPGANGRCNKIFRDHLGIQYRILSTSSVSCCIGHRFVIRRYHLAS